MSFTGLSPSSPPLNRRDRLTAALHALTSNDTTDPELFKYGEEWLKIADTIPVSISDCVNTSQSPVLPEEQTNIDPALCPEPAFPHNLSGDEFDGSLIGLEDAIAYNSIHYLLWDSPLFNENANCATPYSSKQCSNDFYSQPFASAPGNWDIPLGQSSSQQPGPDNNYSGVSSIPSCENWGSSSNQIPEEQKGEQNVDVGDFAACSIRSSPKVTEKRGKQSLKRDQVQTSAPDTETHQNSSSIVVHRPQKRQRTHYVIEKRYRAGLGEKFDALRECVEAMKKSQPHPQQVTTPPSNENPTGEGDNSNGGSKMGKAEVLTEAVTLIQQIKEENEVLLEHLRLLIRRLRAMKLALFQD
ncbi:hypothetical protein BKA64DRAFT_764969 [Cadophora sp. MPI-SDFR-AT-0126]|nr:hypothetical protein BKA64DRAFT_764969 [Leotiomycetes sp. MPI-SDFR-AT-0126]